MSNYKLQPLTEKEKEMAEKYHNMVYTFLHSKGYDIEEYYDIAVMGYLKAVQKYFRDDDLKLKWSFKAICYNDMRREIGNQTKKENTKKRMPEGGFTSLDLQLEDSNESFTNSIVTQTLEDEFFEEYDRLEEANRIKSVLAQLTDTQRRIVLLKADGKTNQEMAEKMQIPYQKINWELNKIRNLMLPNKPQKIKINANVHSKYLIKCLGAPIDVILCLSLPPRQKEVFNLLLEGYKQVDIANNLNISKFAVNEAVRQIRKKAEKVR